MNLKCLDQPYDLAIIGGSIAGSLCANLLKAQGIRIILIEKDEHPRPKGCGEGFSKISANLLRSVCPELDFAKIEHRSFDSYKFIWPQSELKLAGKKICRGLGISRTCLDNYLYHLSDNDKEITKLKANVQTVAKGSDGWNISTDRGNLAAKFIIAADGYRSKIATQCGILKKEKKSQRFGLSSWWEAKVPHELKDVCVYPYQNSEIYLTPISDTKINFTILGNKHDIQTFSNAPELLNQFLNEKLCNNFEKIGSSIGSGTFGSRLEKVYGKDILFVGDAARSFDPASGLGMYHAIFSAQLAVKYIKAKLLNPKISEKRYELVLNSHNLILSVYERTCLLIPKILRLPFLNKILKCCGVLNVVDRLLRQITDLNLKSHLFISTKLLPVEVKGPAWTVVYGIFTLIAFAAAVLLMNFRLFYAMDYEPVDLPKINPWILNICLILQFPILHSLLLGRWRNFLSFGSKGKTAKKLTITNYSLIASLQLLLVFGLWQFCGERVYALPNALFGLFTVLFGLSSLYLAKAMYDAGLGLQLGYSGWIAARKNQNVQYPGMPTKGTFKACRQPIYFSFFLLLWLSPYFSLDKVLLASCWSLYCFIGPIFKEKRFLKQFGSDFESYQKQTPYFLPSLQISLLKGKQAR